MNSKSNSVGQAFQPAVDAPAGWKACPTWLITVLVLLMLCGCRRETPADPAPKEKISPKQIATKEPANDHERIQGTWRAVRSELNGRQLGITAIWTFKDNKATLQEGFGALKTEEGTFVLDAKAGTLNLNMEGMSYRCIYRFDGDELAVCFDESGVLPEEFSSKGPTRVLHNFERES